MANIVLLSEGNQSDRRLQRRIETLNANPPDTEYSYYGPINTILHRYFTLDGYWMIKPQAIIRELVAGHGSTDSTGRNVRRSGRDGVKRPDFIVVRFSGTGREDVVNLVIEIKPGFGNQESDYYREGLQQLNSYVSMLEPGLQDARGGGGNLRAVLILRTEAFAFRWNSTVKALDDCGIGEIGGGLPVGGVSILSPTFHEFLLARAGYNQLPYPPQ